MTLYQGYFPPPSICMEDTPEVFHHYPPVSGRSLKQEGRREAALKWVRFDCLDRGYVGGLDAPWTFFDHKLDVLAFV